MYYIGLDVGGTTFKAGVVTEDGRIVHKDAMPTGIERPYQEIIADMAALCKKVAEDAGIPMSEIKSIGVGVPGIAIPRTSSDQADMGISVRRSEMQKGDVLVFRTSRTGTHTALYIGSDNFIHSPKPGKRVKKDTLKLPYWNDRLIAVRRILY